MEVRLGSVAYAGIFARAREEGIEPSGAELAETIRMTATEGAYTNTELHYTLELLDILARIRAHSFVFTSPPIKGVMSPNVVSYTAAGGDQGLPLQSATGLRIAVSCTSGGLPAREGQCHRTSERKASIQEG